MKNEIKYNVIDTDTGIILGYIDECALCNDVGYTDHEMIDALIECAISDGIFNDTFNYTVVVGNTKVGIHF